MTVLTKEQANAVYDILVEHGGAYPNDRHDFVFHQTTTAPAEWRFGGDLGFGGKFWNCNGKWYVTAYPEDAKRYPDKSANIIGTTNAALDRLRYQFLARRER